MNFVTYALKSIGVHARNVISSASNSKRPDNAGRIIQYPIIHERSGDPTAVVVWSINAGTGRLECRWTCDSEEIARWRGLSSFQRFGFVLAGGRQNRFANMVH